MKKKFLSVLMAAVFLIPANVSADFHVVSEYGKVSTETPGTGKVTLIVETEGEPVLASEEAQAEGAALYGQSAEAEYKKAELLKIQKQVEEDIAEVIPGIEKNFVYTNVFSGFSVEAYEEDIEKIKALPNVKNVYISENIPVPEPQLSVSGELINSAYSYDTLGYNGEGRVICVIDSEFDVNHEFFQAAPENPKYGKQELESVIEKMVNLNKYAAGTVNKVYRSSKIPIAFDYTDNDTDTYPENTSVIHGTHVAGIAAGKNGTAPDGTPFSGVAPEAQLILLKVGSASGLTTAAIIAAFDDVSLLDIDAVNMSFGYTYVYNKDLYENILTVARDSGINVNVSAGNESRGYDDEPVLTTNIDYSSDGLPANADKAFSVASAQNAAIWRSLGKLTVDGENISFMNTNGSSTSFDAAFKEQTVMLEYCGSGTEADFDGVSLAGKVAVVLEGDESFSVRMERAREAGAEGILYILNNDYVNVQLVNISNTSGDILPGAIVRNMYKDKIINASEAVVHEVSAVNESVLNGGIISSFSSYGTNEDLCLKPDITAPGGNIYSSYPGDTYTSMSGTSMASPHMSGVSALMSQFMDENFADVTGADRTVLMQNLLMSSARIVKDENNIPYSPRVQGSGLVDIEGAFKTPVVLRGDNESTKLSLLDKLDKLGNDFELSFTAVNLTDNDVVYDEINLYTTTDGYYTENDKNYVGDAVSLKNTAELPESVTVPANGTAQINITVSLDSTQTSENLNIFTNGFFVDGFVVLSQSDGQYPEISIPFTGFYGDWLDAPLFDKPRTSSDSVTGNFGIVSNLGDKLYYTGINLFSEETIADEKYVAISPDGDGYFDSFYISPSPLRGLSQLVFEFKNAQGSSMGKATVKNVAKLRSSLWSLPFVSNFEDGNYTLEMTGTHIYDTEGARKETISVPFVIDTEAPQFISASVTENNGKKYLGMKVSDNHYISYIIVEGTADGETVSKSYAIDPEKSIDSEGVFETEIEITGMDADSITVQAVDFAFNSVEMPLDACENGMCIVIPDDGITCGESGTTIEGTIFNAGNKTIDCDVLIGFYDENEKLSGVVKETVSLSPGSNSVSFSSSEDLSSASYTRVFFWSNEMVPLRKKQEI